MDPFYHLLQKGKNFEWRREHAEAMRKLKKVLCRAESLKKPDYGRPMIVTVDIRPTGIGCIINQANMEGNQEPICFRAKLLNYRQRKYAQVKGELWGIVLAIKMDHEYLMGKDVIIEMDCLSVLGMM